MENTTKWVRGFAATICLVIIIWSLFGMFSVPYYMAIEFPLIRKEAEIRYEQRFGPPDTGVAWLFRKLN